MATRVNTQYIKNKTTNNQLINMFLESKNENLYDSIRTSSYYKDFSDGRLLKDLEKSEKRLINAYEDTQTLSVTIGAYLESNSVLQGLIDLKEDVKDTATFLTNLTPGKMDNILVKLLRTPDDITQKFIDYFQNEYDFAKKELNSAKDNMYDLMVRGMYDLQKLGELVREDTFYYHFGTTNKDKELEIFQIDSDAMHKLEQNKNLFQVSIDKTTRKSGKDYYSIQFQSQSDIKNDFIKELQTLVNKDKKDSNLMLALTDEQQNYWKDIAGTKLYSSKLDKDGNKKEIGYGRKFEIFEEDIWGDQNLNSPSAFIQAQLFGKDLDTNRWMTQGDITNKTTNTSIQDKFITDSRFGVSYLSTIKNGLQFYTNAIEDYKNNKGDKKSEFWAEIDRLRFDGDPSLQKVDGEGTTVFEQQTQQELQEEANDMAEEEMDNLMNDFFAT